MIILGADGLTSGINAMNKIDGSYLSHGDCCCAKYNDKFYWYDIDSNSGATESLPNIVEPAVNASSKRWILRNIYLTELEVETVYTNNLLPLSGGTGVNLGGSALLSGGVFTFTNTTEPPFLVLSTALVENLNAEYWGGIHYSEFSIDSFIDSGEQSISSGVDTVHVDFSASRDDLGYSLFTEIHNTTLSEPSMLTHMVTERTLTGFDVVLSADTDGAGYKLQWAVFG